MITLEEIELKLKTLEDSNMRIKSIGTKSIKDEISTQVFTFKAIPDATALSTGDDKGTFVIPEELDGMNLVSCGAHVFTVSSSGLPTIQLANAAVDMLSTKITIDENETDSVTAATPAVIDTTKDGVSEGDVIGVDVDISGTSTKGLEIRLGFRMPII